MTSLPPDWKEAFALTNHEAFFSALNAQRLSDVLSFPSQDPPVAYYVSLNKLSAQCMSDTALAVRLYKKTNRESPCGFLFLLAPNACQAQSRGHGGSHEIHEILTDATQEQSPDNWRSARPQGIQGK